MGDVDGVVHRPNQDLINDDDQESTRIGVIYPIHVERDNGDMIRLFVGRGGIRQGLRGGRGGWGCTSPESGFG